MEERYLGDEYMFTFSHSNFLGWFNEYDMMSFPPVDTDLLKDLGSGEFLGVSLGNWWAV